MTRALVLIAIAGALAHSTAPAPPSSPSVVVTGTLRAWHRVTLTFDGPRASEQADDNPFRNYRLAVRFSHAGHAAEVPGFYAADGNAGETGASVGSRWRAHFMPDRAGTWQWTASFRRGTDVAVSDDPSAGEPMAFDGATGRLEIGRSNAGGRDFRAHGLLRHEGGHYLRFAGTGEWFLKGGADSPENFLACVDFDGTTPSHAPRRAGEAERALHAYGPHVTDWRPGDPSWRSGKGKGIIGALNYLSSRGMNSVYFLTMNVGGDGDDVFPWISREMRDRFDVSKLDQWETVFSHMTRLGLMLHVVTQETENQTLLDGGELGTLRRLYYRELVARFGHHPAITWNLGEENGEAAEGAPFNTDAQRLAFAAWLKRHDPYGHPIVVHTWPGRQDRIYRPLLGTPDFDGPSLQVHDVREVHAETLKWRELSAQHGRPWFVSLDEIGPPEHGVLPDAEDPEHDAVRADALWGHLMAGGAGVEWYFGYAHAHNDLNAEDWRSRERMWDQTRVALDFFRAHVPLAEAAPADALLRGDGYCLAIPGRVYVVYLREPRQEHAVAAGPTATRNGASIDLSGATGRFTVRWYDPRSGGPLLVGSVRAIEGGAWRALGEPPSDPSRDWVALVSRVS